jgi:hypothetical protein
MFVLIGYSFRTHELAPELKERKTHTCVLDLESLELY